VKQALNVTLKLQHRQVRLQRLDHYNGSRAESRLARKPSNITDVPVNQYYNELQYQAPRELVDVRVDYKWNRKFTPYFPSAK